VIQVFADALGRLATDAEVATFTGILGGGATRSSAALTILSSSEYRTNLIGGYYGAFLHRPASSADVAFWLPAFTIFTDEQIAAQILASPSTLPSPAARTAAGSTASTTTFSVARRPPPR